MLGMVRAAISSRVALRNVSLVTDAGPDSTTSLMSSAPSTVDEGDSETAAGVAEHVGLVGAVGAEALAEQRLGDDGLEAATLAAGARLTVLVDHDVADLAGRRTVAGEQRTAEHDPGADALVDAHEDQVLGLAGAEDELGERGRVGVVHHVHGHRHAGAETRPEIEVGPPEVGGGRHGAAGRRRCRGSPRRCRATGGRRRRPDRRRCASTSVSARRPVRSSRA